MFFFLGNLHKFFSVFPATVLLESTVEKDSENDLQPGVCCLECCVLKVKRSFSVTHEVQINLL